MASRRIGWCVASLSTEVASVRYRALMPMYALERLGFRGVIFHHMTPPSLRELDAVVFVKNFPVEAYSIAQEARRLGKAVLLDLCDNIFVDDYGKKGRAKPSDLFLAMSTLADAIVVTTEPLAEVLRSKAGPYLPIFVVPDGVYGDAAQNYALEKMSDALRQRTKPRTFHRRLNDYFLRPDALEPKALFHALKALIRIYIGRRFPQGNSSSPAPEGVARVATVHSKSVEMELSSRSRVAVKAAPPKAMRILWYGNHGATHAKFGMLDLLDIREDLERIAREFPVELIVVSNDRAKYEKYIRPIQIPSRYEEWSAKGVDRWLAKSRVVIVPNSLDAFSICKSANRTIHALVQGVPVVATSTPALHALGKSIATCGFYDGLKKYLNSTAEGKRDVALGLQLIKKHFSDEVLSRAWQEVITFALASGRERQASVPIDMIVVLNLIQDLDLAVPVVEAAQQKGLSLQVWSSVGLLKKSPRVIRQLQACDVPVLGIADQSVDSVVFPAGTRWMVTISETSLGPHRFTRSLVERARQKGILTATMQHGLENVGLTYSDDVHPIENISILSDRIYIWGDIESLHVQIGEDVKQRCVAVGCTKPAYQADHDLDRLIPPEAIVVGVFENLHWHRYSDDYRAFFLSGVAELAAAFPNITFLVKPHHAGMWLTSRFKGGTPQYKNMVIADPADSDWEPFTASGLLGRMMAVITTPSTVALDAARRGVPVAVVARDMELDRYQPLPFIRHMLDWTGFLVSALNLNERRGLLRRNEDYVDRTVKPGDAAGAIVEDLLRQTGKRAGVR